MLAVVDNLISHHFDVNPFRLKLCPSDLFGSTSLIRKYSFQNIRPMVAIRFVFLFCAMQSVHAFVPKTARTKHMVSFSSTSDNESTKRITTPQPPKHNMTDGNHHFYMDPKQEFGETTTDDQAPPKWTPTDDIDPLTLEESLLSQQNAIESLLQKKSRNEESGIEITNAVSPSPKMDSESKENLRFADSIDWSIYQFNTNLVKIVYAITSFLYPMSSEKQPQQYFGLDFPRSAEAISHLSPLLGTEYNGNTEEQGTTLRFERFYILETVARIPYFAYLSVLHFRESLGNRGFLNETDADEKRVEAMRTHYAQADNEVHHLLIMEALGGNSRGIDRFLAHTMAFTYYWFVVLVFLWKEQAAYHLNEIIEDHAYKTYDEVRC